MPPVAQRMLALIGVAVAAPVFAVVALAVWWDDGFPLLFRHKRVGREGSSFELLKFRSMYTENSGPQITSGGDARVTRVGRVLRKYKLDELPQLLNVVRGEMNLIGPRPEVAEYVDLSPLWRQTLKRTPGVTDLASLCFRDEEEVLGRQPDPETYYRNVLLPRKLELNVEYAEIASVWNDFRLLGLTAYYSILPSRFDANRVQAMFIGKGAE